LSKYSLQIISLSYWDSKLINGCNHWLFNINFGSDITLLVGAFFGFLVLSFSKVYIKNKLSKDSKDVVIDEFLGQMLASSVAGVSSVFNTFAFILFIFFDILK